jgi:hypothetical protein
MPAHILSRVGCPECDVCGEPGDNRRCLDIDQTIVATLFARADCWNSQAGRRPKSPAPREPFDA